MSRVQDDNVNVTDYHPQNPWGSSHAWHHRGAVAIGICCAHVQANSDASDDALWLKAEAVASGVFDVHLDTGNPVSDAGLLAAIDAAMVPMLYAYMQELREHLRCRSFGQNGSRSGDEGLPPRAGPQLSAVGARRRVVRLAGSPGATAAPWGRPSAQPLLPPPPSLANRAIGRLDEESAMSPKPGCIRPRRTPLQEQEPAVAFVSMVLHG
jgi:hypothetical protein